jgi:hypothetical protein
MNFVVGRRWRRADLRAGYSARVDSRSSAGWMIAPSAAYIFCDRCGAAVVAATTPRAARHSRPQESRATRGIFTLARLRKMLEPENG